MSDADRIGDKRPVKHHTSCGDCIEIRGLHDLITAETGVVRAMLIGNQKQNIRTLAHGVLSLQMRSGSRQP